MVRFIWNKDKTACVRAKKIRDIVITPFGDGVEGFAVKAWFNESDSFLLGRFDNEEEARTFIFNGLN